MYIYVLLVWDGWSVVFVLWLPFGFYCHCTTQENETALLRASYYGHKEVTKLLLKEGADVNLCDEVSIN